jgi:hypothetical protein
VHAQGTGPTGGLYRVSSTLSLGMHPPFAGKGIKMPSDIIVIEKELLKSVAFRNLPRAAYVVYMDFRMKCRIASLKARPGRKKERIILNNGELEYCYSEAEKKGVSRPRFRDAIDALTENGLIDIAHSGNGGRKGDKNLYAISERWRLFGTKEFILVKRPKDNRQGRGFQKGHKYSKRNSNIGNENVTPTSNENVTPNGDQ